MIHQAFDYNILKAIYAFAVATHGFFTPFMRFVSYSCDLSKGYPVLILGIILLFFKKTRKTGLALLAAIVLGVLFTNIFIKNMVGRSRPYNAHIAEYVRWWKYTGATVEGEIYSFPSGHSTSIMAAMMVLFLSLNKKYSWLFLLFALLVGFSRNYLMVHYPTDVLAGLCLGAVCGLFSYFVVNRFVKMKNT